MSTEPESTNVEPEELSAAETPKPKPQPVPKPEPEPEPEPEPAAVVKPAAVPSVSAVVGRGQTDEVLLSRCVYKSRVTRKSLSVHHLQRRLAELGYVDAHTDKDGWYGDYTALAVRSFQRDKGLDPTGEMNADTLSAVFDGDGNVTVVIDA